MNITDAEYQEYMSLRKQMEEVRISNHLAPMVEKFAHALAMGCAMKPYSQWSVAEKVALDHACHFAPHVKQLYLDQLPKSVGTN